MDKSKRKEMLEQKYLSKKEIAKAKQDMVDAMNKIRDEMAKAKIKQKKLATQLRKEKLDDAAEDRKAKAEINAEINKQKIIIAENKKLLREKKATLNADLKLKNAEARNQRLESEKANREKLLATKQQIREERLRQREKIASVRNEVKEKKMESSKLFAEQRQENLNYLASVREELNEKKLQILNHKRELIAKRAEANRLAQSQRAIQIAKSRAEKQDLQKQKINAYQDYKEEVFKIKNKSIANKQESIEERDKLNKEYVDVSKKFIEEKAEMENEMFQQEIKTKKEALLEVQKTNEPDTEEIKVEPIFNDLEDYSPVMEDVSEVVKGNVMEQVGKQGLKLFNKINGKSSDLSIEKLKLPDAEINLIKEMQALKEANNLTDVKEFAKYVSYITGTKITDEKAQIALISIIANLLLGKTLQMFDGYFHLVKVNKYKMIKYYKQVPGSEFSVFSMPDTKSYKKMQETIENKLKDGLVIRVGNNIGLKYVDNEYIVMHDIPFIR